MQRMIAIGALLAMLLAVAGCGGGAPPSPVITPGVPAGPAVASGASDEASAASKEEKAAKPDDGADDPWGDSGAGGKKTVAGAVGSALFRAMTGGAGEKGKAPAAPKSGP